MLCKTDGHDLKLSYSFEQKNER